MARIHLAVRANPKNGVRKWSTETDGSKETVRRVLHENDKSPKKPRVDPHDLTPAQLNKRVGPCTLLFDLSSNTQRTLFIIPQDEK